MAQIAASLAGLPSGRQEARGAVFGRAGTWLLLAGAAGVVLSLLWDFSWESTIGIDLTWSAPHSANYLAVAMLGMSALGLIWVFSAWQPESGVRLAGLSAPVGAWLAMWGAVAFAGSVLFDRWWQSAYGLSAGIWHPPQLCKAASFFAVLVGAWLVWLNQWNRSGETDRFALIGLRFSAGLVLCMITVVSLVWNYPNRQHTAWFCQIGCATYPIVLMATVVAGGREFPATASALAYVLVLCTMTWLLPLFPGTPQTGPIYNRLEHLMPPPFPLLLPAPALGLDLLNNKFSWLGGRFKTWAQAVAGGLVFCSLFIATQWCFSDFLLSEDSANWFFAGGGEHWPFFLKLTPAARRAFWQEDLDWAGLLIALALAVAATRIGLWLGAWMRRLKR
jgi:hypothetical protein